VTDTRVFCDLQCLHLIVVVRLAIIASRWTNVNLLDKSSVSRVSQLDSVNNGMRPTTRRSVVSIQFARGIIFRTMKSRVAMENRPAVSVKMFSTSHNTLHRARGQKQETESGFTTAASTVIRMFVVQRHSQKFVLGRYESFWGCIKL